MQQEQHQGPVRAVLACADDRELFWAAMMHAKEKFPNCRIYLLTDFGAIYNILRFEGNLRNHPTVRDMIELGINKASLYPHEHCKKYKKMVVGMNLKEEMRYHFGEMCRFVERIRAEAIPDFSADFNFQELDGAKEHVSIIHDMNESSDMAVAAA